MVRVKWKKNRRRKSGVGGVARTGLHGWQVVIWQDGSLPHSTYSRVPPQGLHTYIQEHRSCMHLHIHIMYTCGGRTRYTCLMNTHCLSSVSLQLCYKLFTKKCRMRDGEDTRSHISCCFLFKRPFIKWMSPVFEHFIERVRLFQPWRFSGYFYFW